MAAEALSRVLDRAAAELDPEALRPVTRRMLAWNTQRSKKLPTQRAE